jgi:glycosyltransferase involved in cell wall biosynthesis
MTERAAANGRQSGIRVALVITGLEFGGAERCLTNLACGLHGDGFQISVYSLRLPPARPRDRLVRQLKRAQIPIHFLELRTRLQLFAAIRRLREHFAANRPDLVQNFLFHANVVGTIAAARCGVRAICTGIRVAERGSWRWWLLRRTKHLVTRHVCVSQSVADIAGRRLGEPAKRLTVIPNGINASQFQGAKAADMTPLGVAPGRRVIAAVARLERQKGIDWLLRLMPNVFAQLPDHDLLVVGDGPNRSSLERFATSLGIADRVHFALWQNDIPAILRASDMFVLPSRWEGMPNALLEAMASGLPVVASDVEGVAESLSAADERQVVPATDAAAFARQVVQWGRQPRAAKQTGARNSRTAAERFSVDSMIRQYRTLYESLFRV